MIEPEQALERARASAEEMRASGAYADSGAHADSGDAGFRVEPTDGVTTAQLIEWALIEPDPSNLYSTRRLGAPITFVKRLMLRGLRQYLAEIVAQQTRFNIHLTAYVGQLTLRVEALERGEQPHTADPPAAPQPPRPPVDGP